MSLVRWADPFSMMRWPANAFDDVDFDALSTSVASNNLDVFETENEIIVRANVAGIPESRVDITYEKGVLWIRAMEEEEKKEKTLGTARSKVGRGMRAEKIRTYNFPQNRVTDHRIGKSWHNLEDILEGKMEKMVEAM